MFSGNCPAARGDFVSSCRKRVSSSPDSLAYFDDSRASAPRFPALRLSGWDLRTSWATVNKTEISPYSDATPIVASSFACRVRSADRRPQVAPRCLPDRPMRLFGEAISENSGRVRGTLLRFLLYRRLEDVRGSGFRERHTVSQRQPQALTEGSNVWPAALKCSDLFYPGQCLDNGTTRFKLHPKFPSRHCFQRFSDFLAVGC